MMGTFRPNFFSALYARILRSTSAHPKHYDFCIGGGAYDPADGLWKPNEKGLGYGRVLDYIGVRY